MKYAFIEKMINSSSYTEINEYILYQETEVYCHKIQKLKIR